MCPFHVLYIGLLDAGGSRMFLRTVVTHHFMYGFVAFTDELCWRLVYHIGTAIWEINA